MPKLSAQSLVELAAGEIRGRILAGALLPGERLREEHLAAELGISRPPLREALRTLESEGFVESVPRRGVVVSALREQDAWEIATLRSALERCAMELALPVTADRLVDCRAALQSMRDAATQENPAAFVNASFDFHLAVVQLARHQRLTAAYRSLYLQMQRCMALNVRTREDRLGETLNENVARHETLLKLIEAGNLHDVLEAFADHGERAFLAEVFGGASLAAHATRS